MQKELTQPGALLSVSYKDGIDRLAKALHDKGYAIYSTGGTARHLEKLGIPFIEVSEFTVFPEMMDGRVKTLHPKVFGSILGRTDVLGDLKSMQEHGMVLMDIVVVNLYPFQEEAAKGDKTTHANIIEKIDVGGPSMLRAAAKNHARVSAICDPRDYDILAAILESDAEISLEQREEWCEKVFELMSVYETSIWRYIRSYRTANRVVAKPAERPPSSDEHEVGA